MSKSARFPAKRGPAVNNIEEKEKGPMNGAQHWAKDDREDEAGGQALKEVSEL